LHFVPLIDAAMRCDGGSIMKTTWKSWTVGLLTAAGLCASPMALANMDSHEKFQKMDTNGDGRVSRDEHASFAKSKFAKMDANGDNSVTTAEMESAWQKHAGKRTDGKQLSAADKLNKLDKNGDGRLSAEEHTSGTADMFQQMDANSDGSLSESELKTGHEALLRK
jgi:hypothetical protein